MQTIRDIVKPIAEEQIKYRLSKLESLNAPAITIENEKSLLAKPLSTVRNVTNHFVTHTEQRKTGLIMHIHDNPNKAFLTTSKDAKFRFEVKWLLPHQVNEVK